MGRPRRKNQPEAPAPRHPRPVARAVPPSLDPPPSMPALYPIAGKAIDATPFGRVTSPYTRWKLVRQGKLHAVRIGRRIYLTELGIADFLARGGAR